MWEESMADDSFFDAQEHNLIKSTIVGKYFRAWSRVLLPQVKKKNSNIAYIDLFSGPGQFSDGVKSTPLIILEMAIDDPELQSRLITVFNDKNDAHVKSLHHAIDELPGIERLHHLPRAWNEEVDGHLLGKLNQLNLDQASFSQTHGQTHGDIKVYPANSSIQHCENGDRIVFSFSTIAGSTPRFTMTDLLATWR
jgi:hypothetical protein